MPQIAGQAYGRLTQARSPPGNPARFTVSSFSTLSQAWACGRARMSFELLAKPVLPAPHWSSWPPGNGQPGPAGRGRARLAQHSRNALVEPRRIAKASPDFIPFAATLEQGIGSPLSTVLIRVETEFTPANIFEGCPTIWIAARLECLAIAHPAEQIANGITDGP